MSTSVSKYLNAQVGKTTKTKALPLGNVVFACTRESIKSSAVKGKNK